MNTYSVCSAWRPASKYISKPLSWAAVRALSGWQTYLRTYRRALFALFAFFAAVGFTLFAQAAPDAVYIEQPLFDDQLEASFFAVWKPPSANTPSSATYPDSLPSTPQIVDPLRPLAHIKMPPKEMQVHAMVVTVADPVETHLARVFDVQISSLVRALHVRGYVLDGFAFTWKPRKPRGFKDRDGAAIANDAEDRKLQRDTPSVMVFRKDLWRHKNTEWAAEAKRDPGVAYIVVYLVGESPSFGVQGKAFEAASKKVLQLNISSVEQQPLGIPDCGEGLKQPMLGSAAKYACKPSILPIIGPTFSGSMHSLAMGVSRVRNAQPNRSVYTSIMSPSATVKSNQKGVRWSMKLAGDTYGQPITYQSLAASLEDQLRTICSEVPLKRTSIRDDDGKIVVLTEESTFGRGIYAILNDWKKGCEDKSCPIESQPNEVVRQCEKDLDCSERIRITPFPQNIFAIRAEHSGVDREEREALRKLTQSKSKLLELDLSSVSEHADRPRPYDSLLSSRSDELMLYGTFDAMKVWVKPSLVVIVATDVRDRLFLLNEVRKNLPMALPVLLEMDLLTTHPDYRKISRGSVVIPSANAIVKLDMENGKEVGAGEQDVEYHAFPSDYAANMFRAGLVRADCFETNPMGSLNCPLPGAPLKVMTFAPAPYVTTLAGFQKINGGRSRFVAADSRLRFKTPAYVMCAVLALFLLYCSYCIHQSARKNEFAVCLSWREMVWERSTSKPLFSTGATSSRSWAPTLLLILSGGILLIVVVTSLSIQWPKPECLIDSSSAGSFLFDCLKRDRPNRALVHGRDASALFWLFLFYAFVAVLGLSRLSLWRARYNALVCGDDSECINPGREKCDQLKGMGAIEWASVAVVALAFLLTFFGVIIKSPVSIDSLWLPIAMSLTILPLGVWFLYQFNRQWRHWAHLAMLLGRAMDWISSNRQHSNPCGDKSWPNPFALGELPQSPFSLRFRRQDLAALEHPASDAQWLKVTNTLLLGRDWPFFDGVGQTFEQWQARLVAEMRIAAVAVRTSAWCAILAPTIILLAMSVYPAPWERLQTTISIAFVVIAFLLVIYVVLRLERVPLLARMFTEHGDTLSVSSAFGALWPKLIAAAVILVPALVPDSLDWIYSLLSSISSLG